MSAKLPRNGAFVISCEQDRALDQKSNTITVFSCSVATACSDGGKQEQAEQRPQAVQLNAGFPSEPVSHGNPQVALASHLCNCQHLKTQNISHECDLQQKQLLHLQRLVQEQNTVLSLLCPGLLLPPTSVPQYHGNSLVKYPEMDPATRIDGLLDFRKCSTSSAVTGTEPKTEDHSSPQPTHHCDTLLSKTASTEQRSLSPVKEELLEHVEEHCTLSPFGLRRNLPANPEERPIHPGVKDKEKTFEDFVEEQLKLDKEPLRKEIQIRTGATSTVKGNFLHKGDGGARIKKRVKSMEQQPSVCVLQHSDKSRRMRSSPVTQQRSIPALLDPLHTEAHSNPSEQRSEIRDKDGGVRNSMDSRDGKALACDVCLLSNNKNQRPYLACNSSSVDNSDSQNRDPIKSDQKCDQRRESHIQHNRHNQSCNGLSSNKSDLTAGPLKERVSFKKVNDRIVRVTERSDSPSSTHGLILSTEIKQLFLHSDSSDSTSAEDYPVSQGHRLPKPPSNPSRVDDGDKNVDWSDEDYASDPLSDAGDGAPGRGRTPRCLLAKIYDTAGSSSDGSDAEIQCLHWSQTDTVKEAPLSQDRRALEKEGEATPCTSDLLGRVFPRFSCPGEARAEGGCSERTFIREVSHSGRPLQNIQGRNGLGVRTGASSDLMKDKMKTEQDKAPSFIRTEMDYFSNNDKDSTGTSRLLPHIHPESPLDLSETQDLKQQIQYLKKCLAKREREWWQVHSELQGRVDALTREKQVLLSQRAWSERSRHTAGRATTHPTAQSTISRGAINNVQDKKEQRTQSMRRDTSDSRTSTASHSPEDNDEILYSCHEAKLIPDTKNGGTQVALQASKAVVREEIRHPDGKIEQFLSNGSRVVVFRNGTKKEIGADQKSVKVSFFNGDVKRILPDGTMKWRENSGIY
ncbi:uncharacterized protein LOC143523382 isoform X2 [Brachyhypopomus gauderio]|uniref:uncharacterized protein LOC143523382 isoform X2 n=1 Tax=Brachyhypopomus gauderio TaxID=698409 RepID=UPI004042CB65